jgi:hypothetical protein
MNLRQTTTASHTQLPASVETSLLGDLTRQRAEAFVYDCFRHHYQAEIRHFLPVLMSLSDSSQRLQAVLGFRHASHGDQLFLEHYLDQPVEQLLASRIQAPVDRERLLEVGNLAVADNGGGRWLITALTAYLSATQAEWAIFTIGPVLQNAFKRMGLELIELAEARRERLPADEQSLWGNYYEQRPKVMAGNLAHGHGVLLEYCRRERGLMHLWQQAVAVGREAA